MLVVIFIIFIITIVCGIIANYRIWQTVSTKPVEWQIIAQKYIGILKVAVSICFAFILFILMLVFTTIKKWRKIKVFIIYNHENIKFVEKLKENLNKRNLKVDYIPIIKYPEEDEIQYKTSTAIASSDVILALPSYRKENTFMDSELLAASSHKKIIIYIKIDNEQKLPNTSLRGYPIFNYERLYEKNFTPLFHFINFSCSHLRDGLYIIRRALPVFSYALFIILLFLLFLLNAVRNVLGSFGAELGLIIPRYIIHGSIAILALIYLLRFILSLLKRIKFIKIARQKIRTGKFTFKELEKILSNLKADREILECLEEIPLEFRYKQGNENSLWKHYFELYKNEMETQKSVIVLLYGDCFYIGMNNEGSISMDWRKITDTKKLPILIEGKVETIKPHHPQIHLLINRDVIFGRVLDVFRVINESGFETIIIPSGKFLSIINFKKGIAGSGL